MSRKKEAVVFLLDVGPRMHPHLEHAARATADYVLAKMLHKPAHVVALVLFGASETANHLNAEMGEDQYQWIVEKHSMALPDGEYLRTLHTLTGGEGQSDFVDALTVASTLLTREDLRSFDRKIILLSNLCTRVEESFEDGEPVLDAAIAGLATGMQQHAIRLDVVELDAEADEQYREDKQFNLNKLAEINQEVIHTERVFRSGLELCGAFVAHEVGVATNIATLEVGSKLKIQVKVTTKCKRETFPSAGRSAGLEEDVAVVQEAAIVRSKQWHYVDQETYGEDEVQDEHVMPAFLYGAHLCPFSKEEAADFQYPEEKGVKLLGFVDQEQIPRHTYMAQCQLMVPDKSKSGSKNAMVALVAAMARQGVLAVLRMVLTARSRAQLFVATPVEATAAAPAHLLLNALPFMEDVREYRFPSLSKDKWKPTDDQLFAAEGLVEAMSLGEGPVEQLAPETTPNPQIHRLYYELGRRVTYPEQPLQEEDALEKFVLEPRLPSMPDAPAALEKMKEVFPMGQAAKDVRRSRAKVSTEHPLEDFDNLLVKEDLVDEAVDGLAAAIPNIVFGSLGESKFSQAAKLVERLREVCEQHDLPGPFNSLLESLYRRCKEQPGGKLGFWQQLNRRHVRPLCKVEAPSSGMTDEEAQMWLTQRWLDTSSAAPALRPSQQLTQPLYTQFSKF